MGRDDIGDYGRNPEDIKKVRQAFAKSSDGGMSEEERKYRSNKDLIRLVESSNFLSSPMSLTPAKKAFLSNRAIDSIVDGSGNSIPIGLASREEVHFAMLGVYKSAKKENELYEQKYGSKL